jgi:Domain of unknown function (DU1801)
MPTKAATPDEYIAGLPDDRKEAIGAIREAIASNIPDGFEECMCYGMIGWVVPHSIFPDGYHCDPSKPLMLMSLASQKNYISLHHLGLYAGAHLEWFREQWPKHSTSKLDMGKACIRFKRAEDVPLALIGELASKLTPQEWVERYRQAFDRR